MDQPIMRKRGVYSIIVAVLVVGVTTLACLLYVDRMQFGNRLQGRYQKQLYDLIGYVENLETDLSKVSVAASTRQSTLLFGDIWRVAGSAADSVNSLPITHQAISQTSKFLSQVSDFSFSLVRLQSSGGKLTDAEQKNLDALRTNAGYLRTQLLSLQRDIEDGKISWSEIKDEGARVFSQAQTNLIDARFTSMDKAIMDHPTLIYDGPYSENVLNISPKVGIEPEITMEQAKQKVIDFIGRDKVQEIGNYSSKSGGMIPSYPFYVILKGRDKNSPINIDISKNGGHIVYMLDSRNVGRATMDNRRAIDLGLRYLISKGYKDMIPSFSQKTEGILIVNYVYTSSNGASNVVIYPDQIKLKIALDNGDIVGLEAEKYLAAHTARTLNKPKLSIDTARAKASNRIQISNVRLALIPMYSTREVYCYEFVGKKDTTTYIIYINADNGNEENILQLIDTPDGQLAM